MTFIQLVDPFILIFHFALPSKCKKRKKGRELEILSYRKLNISPVFKQHCLCECHESVMNNGWNNKRNNIESQFDNDFYMKM